MRGVQAAQIGWVLWRVLAFGLCAAVLLVLTGAAFAGGSASRKIAALPRAPELQATALARPIPAWSEFCQRVPTECSINLGEPEKITLTRATWNTIKAVNRRVNASIIPLSDQDHWGVSDHWDLPDDGYGDCEDIQLLKRKLLAERGLPRRAMRMTVAIDDRREGHAVLMVRRIAASGTVRNLVCGAIVKPQEGSYGDQEGYTGRATFG